MEIILTGRRQERLEQIAKDLSSPDLVTVHTFAFDIRDRSAVEKFVNENEKLLSNLDVLVNNAGLAAGLEEFPEANLDDWDAMIDTNIKGLLYITRGIIPHMKKRKHGHIINIGSIAGHTIYPKGAVYCATKHAVKVINEGIRMDTLGTGIRVTSVDPGMVETEFSLVRFKGDEAKAKKVYEGLTPLTPEDIAETVYWCLARPPHVNIQEVIIMPTDQASVRDVNRK